MRGERLSITSRRKGGGDTLVLVLVLFLLQLRGAIQSVRSGQVRVAKKRPIEGIQHMDGCDV